MFILFVIIALVECSDLKLHSTTRTSVLEKYESYLNSIIMKLNIPTDTSFVSFKFFAEEVDMSIFGECSPRNVSLYLKYGAPPVINPDGSKMPDSFKNVTRTKMYHLEFQSDKKPHYVNITSPVSGSYIAATFLSYTDPRYNKIEQAGLARECYAYVESNVYIKTAKNINIIMENQEFGVTAIGNESKIFKFYVPNNIDHAIVLLDSINFSEGANKITVLVNSYAIPTETDNTASKTIDSSSTSSELIFVTVQDTWHYLVINFDNNTKSEISLKFKLKYFSSVQETKTDILIKTFPNATEQIIYYNDSLTKYYQSNVKKFYNLETFREYDLVRDGSSDNLLFSYVLEDEINSVLPVALNLTNDHFTALKFNLRPSDVGGTLQFIIAFKPRYKKSKGKFEDEPEENVIVACIRPYSIEVPSWPGHCKFQNVLTTSPLILNKTVDNSTVMIPYPEYGTWYATLKLFCGKCEPCNCSEKCQKAFEDFLAECLKTCTKDCSKCEEISKQKVVEEKECADCDKCDGPCLKTDKKCNSSIVFDVASRPCVGGSCGKNGRCVFLISDGTIYSTCVCSNNYRGWECSDNTLSTPFYMVVIELLLLVLSNLAFLPSVYIAYRRKYYIEAICYFSICFFSTFYHACDAGERIINFCITRLGALQFADFFCALLSIWVTLIAIADLPPLYPSLFHIVGAVVLSFCTTINKTSLWVFMLPVITGLCTVGVSWYLKYRKTRQLFCKKQYLKFYLPIGTAWVVLGLVIYSLLQTSNNYKYLHSMWHIIMATSVIILLPKTDTFKSDLSFEA